VFQKVALPSNHGPAHAQDRLFPLFDVFDQLQRCGVAFLDVVADLLIGLLLTVDHPLVVGTQPELRNIPVIQRNNVFVAFFGDVNIRLHLPRTGTGIAQTGRRIQMPNDVTAI